MSRELSPSWRSNLHFIAASLLVFFLLHSHVVTAADPDYTCSADRPCALGCCGKAGYCGMGPEYCGPGKCINSCNAKAECDPGGWGAQYVQSTSCPLNVCCSKHGFCGTTPDFCGSTVIPNPSCSKSGGSASQRTIAYYEGWGATRPCDAMIPEAIPALAYSHINFAFASIDPVTFGVVASSNGDHDLMQRLTGLKALYPHLKVWISIGGWTFNDPDQPTAFTFSDLAGSVANQRKFFDSLISFMSFYGFDGVDIDWEYPVAPERSGRPGDFQNFPVMLQNLRNAFNAAGKLWGITITLPSSFFYLQRFDIVKLEKTVDWFNIMSYDLHGTWDATSKWTGPYVGAHTNLTEIDASLKLLWRNKINPKKVVLGMGFYGRSFTLADPSCNKAGCRFTEGAPAGPCTGSVGTLSYGEIQRLVAKGAQPRLDTAAGVQTLTYGTRGKYWVSFDDATTIKMKLDYANSVCLGGTMVWAVGLDDAEASASKALSGKPSTGGSGNFTLPILNVGLVVRDPMGSCRWTKCNEDLSFDGACPSGYSSAVKVLDGCPQPGSGLPNHRTLCCPKGDMPTCERPRYGADFPNKRCVQLPCDSDQQLLATTQFPTNEASKPCQDGGAVSICCSNKQSTAALAHSDCTWTSCGGTCPASKSAPLTTSLRGDGGQAPCPANQRRTLCCPPSGIKGSFDKSKCNWFSNAFHGTCTPGCPEGKISVAIDSAGPGCLRGFGSFCCDPPSTLTTRDIWGADPNSFEFSVDRFITNGVCSAVNSPFKRDINSINGVVRSLIVSSTLSKRAFPGPSKQISTHDMALFLVPLLYDWTNSYSERTYIEPLKNYWDAKTKGQYPAFEVLASQVDDINYDGRDAVDRINDSLCGGIQAQNTITQNQQVTKTFCEKVDESDPDDPWLKRRGLSKLSNVTAATGTRGKLARRTFTGFWNVRVDESDQLPATIGDITEVLGHQHLRMEYFRWFRYNGDEVELEVVYLAGWDPAALFWEVQNPGATHERFVVLHVHFRRGATTATNNLVPVQINVRHGERILRTTTNGWHPGYYRVQMITADTFHGVALLECPQGSTGVNVATVHQIARPTGEVIVNNHRANLARLIRDLYDLGTNERHNLFHQPNTHHYPNGGFNTPQAQDPSTFVTDTNGQTRALFRGGIWDTTQPTSSLAYAPDGSLYDPLTRYGGDLATAPGFLG